MGHHCFHCRREIKTDNRAVAVLVIESHTGKIGSAKLHSEVIHQYFRSRLVIAWHCRSLSRLVMRQWVSHGAETQDVNPEWRGTLTWVVWATGFDPPYGLRNSLVSTDCNKAAPRR